MAISDHNLVWVDMEMTGVTLDDGHLTRFSAALQSQLEVLQADIQRLAGSPFNVDSPKQLGDILFEH